VSPNTIQLTSTDPKSLPFENLFIGTMPWHVKPIDVIDGLAIITKITVEHRVRKRSVFFKRCMEEESLMLKWQRKRFRLSEFHTVVETEVGKDVKDVKGQVIGLQANEEAEILKEEFSDVEDAIMETYDF